MKKEKTVKTHTRKTKSGKTVTVKQHTAKYDAAEQAKEIVKKAGAGVELEKVRKSKLQDDPYKEYGFTAEEFAEWYEGTGSKADKKVEKALRKALGRKAYDELNDAAANGYKKGGAAEFFEKSVYEDKYPAYLKQKSKLALAAAKKETTPKAKEPKVKESSSIDSRIDLAAAKLERKGWKLHATNIGDETTIHAMGPDGSYYEFRRTREGVAKTLEDLANPKKAESVKKIGLVYERTKSLKEPKSKESKVASLLSVSGKNYVAVRPSSEHNIGEYLYVRGGKVYRESGKGFRRVYKKHLGEEAYNYVLGVATKTSETEGNKAIKKSIVEKTPKGKKEKVKSTAVPKTKTRKKKKNTPEEDAALDATLAEIRERNKQPYQVSRRV